MENVLKSDIFFFITSVAVVVIAVLLTVLIIYLIKVSKDIKYISQKAKAEADNIIEDVSALRNNLKEQGKKVKDMSSIINLFKKTKKDK